jgi:hypothetical protein
LLNKSKDALTPARRVLPLTTARSAAGCEADALCADGVASSIATTIAPSPVNSRIWRRRSCSTTTRTSGASRATSGWRTSSSSISRRSTRPRSS